MAGVRAVVNSGEITMGASATRTVLSIVAATNQRVLVRSIRLLGKQPAGGTDTPIKIRCTRAGTGGTTSALTPAKVDPSDSETLQTTAKTYTAEPSAVTDAGFLWEVQPQAAIEEFLPIGEEIKIPGGTQLNWEATTTSGATLAITVGYEE